MGYELKCYASWWRHNERDCVSNHQLHGCFLNCLFRRRSKKTSKLRVTGLCVQGIHRWTVNSPHKWPVTRKMFPFGDVIMIVAKAMIHISKNRKRFPRPGSWNLISVQPDPRNVCFAIHITTCLMNPISHLYVLLHRGFQTICSRGCSKLDKKMMV